MREGLAASKNEHERTSVYGKVVSIGRGILVLDVTNIEGKGEYTFVYDDNTKFVYVNNDSASTELPLSTDTIEVGTGLNICYGAIASLDSYYCFCGRGHRHGLFAIAQS